MQHRRNLDWQIRRLLRKYPVPSQQTKEELWKGIAAALDEQQPVRRSYRGLGVGIVATAMFAVAAGVYFWNSPEKVTGKNEHTVISQESRSEPWVAQTDRFTESPKLSTTNSGEVNTRPSAKTESPVITYRKHIRKHLPHSITTTVNADQQHAIQQEIVTPVIAQQEEVAVQNSAPAKDRMERFSSLVHDLRLAPGTTPLLAQATAKYKGKKTPAPRNKSSWASLVFNIWDNPAYTGKAGKLSLVYDDQMSFFDYGRNAIYRDIFAADWQIPHTPISIGAYHDRSLNSYSLKTATAFSLSAKVLQFGGGQLSLGGSVSSLSKKFFINSLHYSDQYDINFGFSEVTRQRAFTSTNTTLGVDAGAWYQSKNLMGGVSVKNVNAPLFGYTEQGERLTRTWHLAGGYRININKLQVLPMVEIERNKLYGQATTTILVTYDDKVTVGGTYQNINPETLRGDMLAYVGVKAFDRVTIFTSYGLSGEMAAKDINRHLIQSGLRFQLPQ